MNGGGFHYRLPMGAELTDYNHCRFRIWAPDPEALELELLDDDRVRQRLPMAKDREGFFNCEAEAPAGTAYYYRLPDGLRIPDPAARAQRDDVHGPSLVVDPNAYRWHHPEWRGRPWTEMVIYEIHPGCWGGFAGIIDRLDDLKDLGITAVELMPVADFPGRHNWGYDGVLPFAPDRSYGSPDDLKALVDAAHRRGLCIYLDVVYNHFGPEGNFLHAYASPFFSEEDSPWGARIDFRRPEVRQFFTHNALYWLLEYRFDGLRFDAVHAIHQPDWLDEMATQVRAGTEPGRQVHLVLENERNRAHHLEQDLDAQWNDDGHNVLHVLLTGEKEGYYANYQDRPLAMLARVLESGFVYQGESSVIHGGEPRGSPSGHLAPWQFVLFLQNHDQVGNRALGERLTQLCDPAALRAAVTLQLLCPQIPLLFMEEERGSTRPFLFFTDFHGELAAAVREGRRREFGGFSAFADPAQRACIPDPNAEETFLRAAGKIGDPSDEDRSANCRDFYKRLLGIRHSHIVPRLGGCKSLGSEIIDNRAVTAHWQFADGARLHLVTNLFPADCGAVTAPPGELLAESRAGAHRRLQGGEILHYSTAAYLQAGPAS